MNRSIALVALSLGLAVPFVGAAPKSVAPVAAKKPVWPASTEAILKRAGANRAQIGDALRRVPQNQRAGLEFLLENMPDGDLKSLKSGYLLKNVALAYVARDAAPWKARVSNALFFNDVLPYAVLNEERDDWRAMLRQKSLPLVAGCKTPSEAAMKLNKELFPLLNVKYSTARKRPDQNVSQCLESGLASCSGLSIVLVNACRAVGIPARIAGTPMWANGRGNHTWVEIWDDGWQFLGAAEPDDAGLNRGWFVGDAAQARENVAQNAIYATSWKKTGVSFPLIWDLKDQSVAAVNVTRRYAPDQSVRVAAPDKTQLSFAFVNAEKKRVAIKISVADEKGTVLGEGTTRDETADANDLLTVEVPRNTRVRVRFQPPSLPFVFVVNSGDKAQTTLTIPLPTFQNVVGARELQEIKPLTLPPAYVPPVAVPFDAKTSEMVDVELAKYLYSPIEARQNFNFSAQMDALLLQNEAAMRAEVWKAFKNATFAEEKADFDAKRVRFDKHESAYIHKTVGERPKNGWPLFIAMHGGGGTAKEVNDSQWRGMANHYKDHPELGGYQYISLRAPNDTWNGFYDDYVYPLISNLTFNFRRFGDIDPNKVFIMGYSHGGYGAYAIGPKMPDHFAAIHASAGAATDGESVPETLRNTVFTAMVGERDVAYDRLTRNQRFSDQLKALKGDRTDIFPARVDVMLGFEHGNLRDGDKIVEMYPAMRNPVPRELTWLQTDGVIRDFFWLQSDNPGKTRRMDATLRDNSLVVTTQNDAKGRVFMDSRLIDFAKPLEVSINGVKSQVKVRPSLKTLCETMARRRDPELAFSASVEIG